MNKHNPEILKLHWDKVSSAKSQWRSSRGNHYAIWPEPVDADICFEKAGFTKFDDSTDAYDVELLTIARSLISSL